MQSITAYGIIIINGNTPPTIENYPTNIIQEKNGGIVGPAVNFLRPTTTNDCTNMTIAYTAGLSSGSVFPLGLTTVTLEATNATGNISNCLSDEEPPSIICPTSQTIKAIGSACTAALPDLTYQTFASDNCATNGGTVVGNIFAQIATGHYHSLAVADNGTLWAWGEDSQGQLGNGSNLSDDQPNPVKIGADTNWVAVAAGHYHSLALKSNGTLWAWGQNVEGQLGNDGVNRQDSPIQVGTDAGLGSY